MSGYGDMWKSEQRAEFIRTWASGDLPELTLENLRFNVARANAAEAELREIKSILRQLKDLFRRSI